MTKNKKAPKPTPKQDGAEDIGKKILVNVILDRSGSMQPTQAETISGYNSYLSGLKDDKETEYSITLTQFDAPSDVPELLISYDDKPLADVPDLTLETYQPRGWTPLYDAIGETIRRVEDNTKGRPVLTVIITDGHENASREFTQATIKALMDSKKAAGWTFVFLAADIDAYAAGGAIGTQVGNTANFTKQKISTAFAQSAGATRMYAANRRMTGATGQSMGESFYTNSMKSMFGDTDPLAQTPPAQPPPPVPPTVGRPGGAASRFPGRPKRTWRTTTSD